MEEAVVILDKDSFDNFGSSYFDSKSENSVNTGPIILEEVLDISIKSCEFLSKSKEACGNEKAKGSIYCTMHKNKLISNIKKSNKGGDIK